MKKRISKTELLRLRRKIKVDKSAEATFINALLKLTKNQLGDKLIKAESFQQIESAIRGLDYSNLSVLSKVLGVKVLKKNRQGFEGILEALSTGVKEQQRQDKREKQFAKALQSLTQDKRIYKPLLDKFNQNIALIKDIPEDVVDKLREAYMAGAGLRGSDIEKELYAKLGSRAKLIVRTESSKLNSALTEVRAKSMRISGYVWSTSVDQRVRASHRMMNDVLVFWNDTPVLDGRAVNAGEDYNCRCVELPVFELDDIVFPVKVAENLRIDSKYDKRTHKDTAKIVGGRIKTYNKKLFLDTYGDRIKLLS